MSLHNCHYNNQGQFKCWGYNAFGQLGLGDKNNRGDNPNQMGSFLPFVNVGTGLKVKSFCGGTRHTCVHLTTNEIKCWGMGTYGQHGLGTSSDKGDTPSTTPDSLSVVNLGSISYPTNIVCGFYHTCVLFANKKVKCFGNNQKGSIGIEGADTKGTLSSDMGDNLNFLNFGTNMEVENLQSFSMSEHNCIIISVTQLMKCWGYNEYYQLGYGDKTDRGKDANTMGNNLQTVDLGTESRVQQIAIGNRFTCALRFDDGLRCFGENNTGNLGVGFLKTVSATGNALTATPYDSTGKKIKQALGGLDEFCVLFDDNLTIKCVGDNSAGELGQGDHNNRGGTPTTTMDKIPAIDLGTGNSLLISRITSITGAICVIFQNNGVKCFGNNVMGNLGMGHSNFIGDGPGEMGSNLAFIDIFQTLSPTPPTLNPTVSPSNKPTPKPTTKPVVGTISNPTLKPTDRSSNASSIKMFWKSNQYLFIYFWIGGIIALNSLS